MFFGIFLIRNICKLNNNEGTIAPPVGIYLFNVNIGNNSPLSGICSKLIIMTLMSFYRQDVQKS